MARSEMAMKVSYKKLWKILIDRDMNKTDLQAMTGLSWASVTKMSKDEPVSMAVMAKVCKTLQVNLGDVAEFVDSE